MTQNYVNFTFNHKIIGFLFDLLQIDEIIHMRVLENIITEFELPIKLDVRATILTILLY
jgi:hypothetical protein